LANLHGTDLHGANLHRANLGEALLDAADLGGTDLRGADLGAADLGGADLRGAVLSGANLSRANLDKVRVGWTTFAAVDLSAVRGLETVEHEGPSSVGVDTLYKSQGRIPQVFFRGCGVPDGLLAYLLSSPSLQQPLQLAAYFLSYSRADEDFCQRLQVRLRDEGLRVWFAPEDLKGGLYIHERLEEAMRSSDRLLVVLSEASLASDWVKLEIRRALQRQRQEEERILFPIRTVASEQIEGREWFDEELGVDLAEELGKCFIPDFSNWQNQEAFEAAFTRLLEDLRAAAFR
jgi:hypothetical protein